MKINREDKVRYLYEYCFWSSIDDHNKNIQEMGGDGTIIRASEARVFRDRLDQVFKDKNVSLETAGFSVFTESVNEVLESRMGQVPYSDGSVSGSKVRRQFSEYMTMSGMQKDSVELTLIGGYLPVSPYDPRFSDRKVMRDLGSRLGGVDVRRVESASDLEIFQQGRYIKVHPDLQVREQGGQMSWAPQGYGSFLTQVDDISGITVLMPYMTASEYQNVVNWVNAGVALDDLTPQTLKRRRMDMQKAVTILEGLSDMGRAYTIVPDKFPGQIQAKIIDTKTNVRLTEKPDSTAYIGAVYDNGARVLYSTTRKKDSGNYPELHYPTPEQALDLVKFSLGEDIKRWDNPFLSVGISDEMSRLFNGRNMIFNSTYHTTNGLVTVVGPYTPKNSKQATSEKNYKNVTRIVFRTDDRTVDTTDMANELEAEIYLRGAINNARTTYYDALDIDRLIENAIEYGYDETYVPEYDGDPFVSAMQQSYWDVLIGKRDTLLRPGNETYDDTVGDIGEIQNDSLVGEISTFHTLAYSFEGVDPADIVRQHAQDSVEQYIGQYDVANDGKRFDPVNVSVWDMSEYGVYRNNDDIIKALRLLNINADDLRGDQFYNGAVKDRLIKFDKQQAKPMLDYEDPFILSVFEEIRDSLLHNGCSFDENDILMDNNGVVEYTATVVTTESAYDRSHQKRQPTLITGQIGQFFIPDEKGIVRTQFAGSDNYAFVPGYMASIIPQKMGENKSVEERTRLCGYEQTLRQNIRYTIRQNMLDISQGQMLGLPTSVNNTYRRLHDHRYGLDFEQRYLEQGMPQDILDAIVETQASRVRYSNEIRDGSTMFAMSNAERYDNYDYANDNTGDTFVLTGGRNMAILTQEADGYFDPIATTATSTNQGVLRFLTQDARVLPDGSIVPGDKNGRAALMAHDMFQYMEYNPFDRQCMTVSNVMQSNAVTDPVMVGQLTFGGWTQDDAMVVSKGFANAYPMRNKDSGLRPLTVGDKLSDPNGNKGVISLVVDPDMPLDEASRLGIEDQVRWFKNNPDMAMVMAPFPAVSRFNGGTFREMTTKHKPLIDLNGDEIAGGLGAMRIIVTDKSVEAKTQVYDDGMIQQGKGRRASGQFAWSLNAKHAPSIMRECYNGNSGVAANFRELLIATGLDMTETGEIRKGYSAHEGETRNMIILPDTLAYVPHRNAMMLDMKKMTKDFREEISRKGGVLELPFVLKYPTGEDLPPLNDGKTNVIYRKQEWERKGYTRKDGVYVRPTTVRRHDDASTERQIDGTTWGLPVMSSYLRSGQRFEDATSTVHDYTNQYIKIFQSAILYKNAETWLAAGDLSDVDKQKYEQTLVRMQENAQTAYDRIVNDIKVRCFEGKNNIVRDEMMSRRMPNSATVVWTPDPRLGIDEVAIGPKVAEVLGIKPYSENDQYVMVWRDPILRDSCVRYMKCVIDSSLTGCAINPNMATPFDGDFDGDTVAVVNLQTSSAQKEAMDKFSVGANLLDKGHRVEITDPRTGETFSCYPLSMNDGLDIQVARYYDKSLDDQWSIMTLETNKMEDYFDNDKIGYHLLLDKRKDMVEQLNEYYYKCETLSTGKAYIRSDSIESHVQSVWDACIETGAKGSPGKFEGYLKYVGIKGVSIAENNLYTTHIKDADKTLATREDHQGVMVATAVKSFGTGVAGSVSQRGVRALRNKCPKAVLELTYPVTQAVLQAKHDPVDARHKYELLMGPVRHVWRGGVLKQDSYGNWQILRDTDGQPIKATPEVWAKSFEEFYTDASGLNVNINPAYIQEVAGALTDKDGYVMSVEPLNEKERPLGSLMDRMAYGGDFGVLVEAANSGENIYEGYYNYQFAPRKVRINQKIMKERLEYQDLENPVLEKPLRNLVKTDTIEAGKERTLPVKQKVSVNVRRSCDVNTVQHHDGSEDESNFVL